MVCWKNNSNFRAIAFIYTIIFIAMKLLLVFMVAFVSVAHAQDADTTVLKKISHEKFLWMIEKDTARLGSLLDADLQYIHSNGWIESKTDVLNDLVSGKLVYKSVVIEKETIRLIGKTGIITGTGMYKVMLEGKEVELKLLYTEVYIQNNKQWKLVQRNACKL